ncbi:hypothetical protein G6F57_002875 [Rhizopus arrhizus]|uniref:Uncharacterized protein n=1 Tax=Rhizopus oryzae TaxID=64495 RepID=A0A9P7BVH6_RHIOR|nr:hypothetical protein G6F23_000462 [Rhizopus arrhizus]KAG1428512.1 hypothetical protein G6F58_000518 [Rhizopus delemar]KAG0917066.1 hypothetical protein G6F33_001839 [Rhizopus arrhizus]KAG0945980.1 hypothetical protein G6F30_003991 [Rhizopus arrhizus]KAG0985022.1 hypothetical protein G6F29_004348 [Rhizopus arrhizus]
MPFHSFSNLARLCIQFFTSFPRLNFTFNLNLTRTCDSYFRLRCETEEFLKSRLFSTFERFGSIKDSTETFETLTHRISLAGAQDRDFQPHKRPRQREPDSTITNQLASTIGVNSLTTNPSSTAKDVARTSSSSSVANKPSASSVVSPTSKVSSVNPVQHTSIEVASPSVFRS